MRAPLPTAKICFSFFPGRLSTAPRFALRKLALPARSWGPLWPRSGRACFKMELAPKNNWLESFWFPSQQPTSGRRKSPHVALSHPSHPQPLGTTHIRISHPMRFKSPHFCKTQWEQNWKGDVANPKNSPHTARTCSKLIGLGSC